MPGCLGVAGLLLATALTFLIGGASSATLVLPLGLPWLGMHLRLDAADRLLHAVVDLGAVLVSLYALGYGRGETAPRRVLPFVPAFLAGMNLVLLADDAFTFLLAWEFMSLTSWALVLREHEGQETRERGLSLSGHGRASARRRLLLCFGLLAGPGGAYDFATIRARDPAMPAAAAGPVPGRVRRRLQGGPGAPACLAAAGACRGTQPCLGADERRHDQGRRLCRHAPPVRPRRPARLVVGCGADAAGRRFGRAGPALRADAEPT